jgi:hypothetical protein
MGKMNCEKNESYFFHMTTPCTIGKSGGIGQVGFKSGLGGHQHLLHIMANNPSWGGHGLS